MSADAASTVVIVGGGAAGAYTALRLRRRLGPGVRLIVVEARDRIGGNARAVQLEVDGEAASYDTGAQFLHPGAQPEVLDLARELGLYDEQAVLRASAGFTVYDRPAGRVDLCLPPDVARALRMRPGQAWNAAKFARFLLALRTLERQTPARWDVSVAEWLGSLGWLDAAFAKRVVSPFLYQFTSLPPARNDEASARYAATYLARTLFGPGPRAPAHAPLETPGLPTFTSQQLRVGVAVLAQRALAASGAEVWLSAPVTAVRGGPDGVTVRVAGQDVRAAQAVVTVDAPTAARLLADDPRGPRLAALPYAPLTILLERGGSIAAPPPEVTQGFNLVVDGDAIAFHVAFGPQRRLTPRGRAVDVTKSWGTPELDPDRSPFVVHVERHHVPLPTVAFIAGREALIAETQGLGGVWLAGGWTTWFDSQQAAWTSAGAAADGVAEARAGARP
ncbi:MAG: FAD-dependent oxidoreductase [Myxococcaceae bacterium]|jgi:predicted NAD/FAD-binding protein|nr:FAD-dependent oxidoreductase [Myxococcaceae bacterium]